MLVWLLERFQPLQEGMEGISSGDSPVFLTARVALASVTAFLAALLFGPFAIAWLQARFRERIDSASEKLNKLHAEKSATPTMGGLFIVAAVLSATLICGDLSNRFVQLGIITVLSFAALGAIDDWIKIRGLQNGLKAKTKFAWQLAPAAVVGGLLYWEQLGHPGGLDLISPVGRWSVPLGLLFLPWSALVIVGSCNGVNLTDGLDGLASGCIVFAGAAFVALSYLAGHAVMADYLELTFISGAGEYAVVMGAAVGATLGFLWFNCYPAQVFMGDTGSLAMGAILGLAGLITRQEALLVVIGGIFVIETLSVIFQVGWFRLTGRRLIACSPLHNHFLFRGDHEIKIVVRFWIGAALLAVIGVASLKIR